VILRPYGIVIEGTLELGLEVVIEDGVIQQMRPHTGVPDLYILSSAFINAHSHLEYRGLMGKIDEPEYSGWIREITRLKKEQSPEQIRADCLLAAQENRATGVAYLMEHSDRPFAGAAMRAVGLEGVIFQEVITFLEHEAPAEKLKLVENNAAISRRDFGGPVYLNPHAYQTVDRDTLRLIASARTPISIHVAETRHENAFTRDGSGPIGDFYRSNNVPFEPTGKSVLGSLNDLELVHEKTQLVHCCALEDDDIDIIVRQGATVAHCPRSNKRLQCPPAPIRDLLNTGVKVGLGLDSAASSGPIDMFAEMRAAIQTSLDRGSFVTPEAVWAMATMKEKAAPLIRIHVENARSIEDVIDRASPDLVEWV